MSAIFGTLTTSWLSLVRNKHQFYSTNKPQITTNEGNLLLTNSLINLNLGPYSRYFICNSNNAYHLWIFITNWHHWLDFFVWVWTNISTFLCLRTANFWSNRYNLDRQKLSPKFLPIIAKIVYEKNHCGHISKP